MSRFPRLLATWSAPPEVLRNVSALAARATDPQIVRAWESIEELEDEVTLKTDEFLNGHNCCRLRCLRTSVSGHYPED